MKAGDEAGLDTFWREVHYAEFNGGHDSLWFPSVPANGLQARAGTTT